MREAQRCRRLLELYFYFVIIPKKIGGLPDLPVVGAAFPVEQTFLHHFVSAYVPPRTIERQGLIEGQILLVYCLCKKTI